MSDDLVFYANPRSRSRIIRWMLEEVGAPYKTEIVEYGAAMKSAEYRALNPMGKVPIIVHKGTVVSECAAICAYLADAFPEAKLAPAAGDPRRGTYYRWLFFCAGPVDAAITNKAFKVDLPADKKGAISYGSYDEAIDTLEKAVTPGPYILGDELSAADVFVGSQIGFALQFKTIEPRPAFTAYWDRLKERPALKNGNAKDDALMKG